MDNLLNKDTFLMTNAHEDSSQDTSTPNMLLLSSISSLGLTYMCMFNSRVHVIKACHEKGNENFQIIFQSKTNCIPTSHTNSQFTLMSTKDLTLRQTCYEIKSWKILKKGSKHSLLATCFFKGKKFGSNLVLNIYLFKYLVLISTSNIIVRVTVVIKTST